MFWAVFLSFLWGICSANAGGFRVLFTSFDPFGGSSANNTQAIAAVLAANPPALGADVTIDVCNLPVVYDQASEVAMKCVAAAHPDAVVSLGEADCELRLETAATNLDDTPGYPDNAGQVRAGSSIVPGGPERSGFNFPVQAMYCALNSSSPSVLVSTSPGGFVCNNTAFHLSQELEAKGIPFTFVHVPNSQCSDSDKNPATNARAIAQMVRAAITDLRSPAAPTASAALWPQLGAVRVLPRTENEAETLLSTLQKDHAPACEQNFAREIVSGY